MAVRKQNDEANSNEKREKKKVCYATTQRPDIAATMLAKEKAKVSRIPEADT